MCKLLWTDRWSNEGSTMTVTPQCGKTVAAVRWVLWQGVLTMLKDSWSSERSTMTGETKTTLNTKWTMGKNFLWPLPPCPTTYLRCAPAHDAISFPNISKKKRKTCRNIRCDPSRRHHKAASGGLCGVSGRLYRVSPGVWIVSKVGCLSCRVSHIVIGQL